MGTDNERPGAGEYAPAAADENPNGFKSWGQSSLWDRWTFSLVTPLIALGLTRPLEHSDLLPLDCWDQSDHIVSLLNATYGKQGSVWIFPRLLMSLWRAYYKDIITSALLSMLEGATRVAAPVILGLFLSSLQDPDAPAWTAYMWGVLLCIINTMQLLVHHVLFLITYRNGCNFKNAATSFIFDSLLTLKASSLSDTSTGKLVNLISNDVSRYEEFLVFLQFGWEAILEMAAIFALLTFLLNFYAALAGVGVTLFFIPVQVFIAKTFARVRNKTARHTDKRIRQLSETIDGIGSVKSYGWEIPFYEYIGELREMECSTIRFSQYLRCINLTLYFCIPPLAGFALFTAYWSTGGTLTLPKVFSSISLLQVLRTAMGRMWTRAMETGSEAIASSARIDKFLELAQGKYSDCPETTAQQVTIVEPPPTNDHIGDERELVSIERSSFSYPAKEEPVLSDVQMSVSRGELVMVVGSVGAGKSSLFSAILRDLERSQSAPSLVRVNPSTKIAYCSQRPWILASSVSANICLAGEQGADTTPHSTELYNLAVNVCRLTDDFVAWPFGDQTEIGEKGVSISGGQKARVALARAVYSNADLYLLDDPLSAVDAHVGNRLFHDCILGSLKGRGKGVVLVTHQLQYLPSADRILVLNENGKQVFFGTFDELSARSEEFAYLDIHQPSTIDNSDASTPRAEAESDCGEKKEAVDLSAKPPLERHYSRITSVRDVFQPHPTQVSGSGKGIAAAIQEEKGDEENRPLERSAVVGENTIIQKEEQVQGEVTLRTYFRYLQAGGSMNGSFALIMTVVGQLIAMVCDYWPRWWADDTYGDQDRVRYVWIFAILVGTCLVAGFVKSISWFSFSLNASKNLHKGSLWGVLHSPLQFFVANPTGRILNRFSKDQNVVDELFPVVSYDVLQSFAFCFAALVLVCIAIPYLVIIVVPLMYSFVFCRARYLRSSREVKRIESISRSPVFADFSATLEGLTTVRAYKIEDRLRRKFRDQVNNNIRAWWTFQLLNRWLGFRLDVQTSIILVAVVLPAVALRKSLDVGLVGFALVYVLNISSLFQFTVRQSAEVENHMTSVERIQAYMSLPAESGYAVSSPPEEVSIVGRVRSCTLGSDASEPLHYEIATAKARTKHAGSYDRVDEKDNIQMKELGTVEDCTKDNFIISNLFVTYRQDLNPILRDISMSIPLGSKVGVCGRTGSGKSSLLLALLRLNLVTSGDIVYRGESLLDMTLECARSLVSVIPQEPHLFSGTIRSNVDPFHKYSDIDIWGALEAAHIKDYLKRDSLGLSAAVAEGGKNFSVGQRQLISLSRAILRESPIVLMDEVTANIDYQTDRLIQATIRSSSALKNATIITIAHRLRTIADSDLVAVIDAGTLVEFGRPKDLLRNSTSQFRALAVETNEFESILNVIELSE